MERQRVVIGYPAHEVRLMHYTDLGMFLYPAQLGHTINTMRPGAEIIENPLRPLSGPT